MPSSVDEGKLEAIELLDNLGVLERTFEVLDVGAGMGTWYDRLSPLLPDAEWDAIEVWQPWASRYALQERYRHVFVQDARTIALEALQGTYDLTIYGDVLEHMTREDAIATVRRLPGDVALFSIPMAGGAYEHQTEHMHDYGTGEDFPDCPYERHLASWTAPDVHEHFHVIAEWTSPNMGIFVVDPGHRGPVGPRALWRF